jgi:Fe2+ transport system protein FeoA
MKTVFIWLAVGYKGGMDTKAAQKLKLKGFNKVEATPQANKALIDRMIDFGLYPGVEFEIVKSLNFSNVTVIRFHQTLLALNEQEFKCLSH